MLQLNIKSFFFLALVCCYSCKREINVLPSNNSTTNPNVINSPITDTTTYIPEIYANMLGVGIDVDWAKTNQGIQYYNEQSVIDFVNRGINHVRIRVAFDMSKELLDTLDVRIKDCLTHGLIPVLAYQADAFKNNPNNESILLTAVKWWEEAAIRFKAYSSKLSFDLMIECSDSLNNYQNRLDKYYELATQKIRLSNPKRIIIISPRKLSNPDYLKELAIPTEHNGYLMAEWHFYASGPSPTNANHQWTTGTPAEKKLITDKIDTAVAWRNRTGIPIWVGAWMPGNYLDGNTYSIAEQVNFATFMSCRLRAKHIFYAVNSDTKFYDRINNVWIPQMAPVVDAFVNPNCP